MTQSPLSPLVLLGLALTEEIHLADLRKQLPTALTGPSNTARCQHGLTEQQFYFPYSFCPLISDLIFNTYRAAHLQFMGTTVLEPINNLSHLSSK